MPIITFLSDAEKLKAGGLNALEARGVCFRGIDPPLSPPVVPWAPDEKRGGAPEAPAGLAGEGPI